MFVLVLAAEADETRQAITFLIVCLVGVAVLLAMLTAWYWHYTSPRRQAEVLAAKRVSEPVLDEPVFEEPVFEEPVFEEPAIPPKAPMAVPSRRERIEVVERSKVASVPTVPVSTVPVSAAPVVAPEPVAVAAHVVATFPETPTASSTGVAPDRADDRADDGPVGDGLSDDAWAAAMKSAFDKLQQ